MAKPLLLPLTLCFLLFLFNGSLAGRNRQFQQQNQCQLDQIQAREPDNRIEAEAGLIESWNPNNDELQCAGVAVLRWTVEPNGLHLPSYSNAPQLIYIVKGNGVLGVVFPGCPEAFEESQQQGHRSKEDRSSFREQDRHQKVRYFREGDIIAIPVGVAYWTYNNGDSSFVAVTLLDTNNNENQLDQNPRRFYLAGNPDDEFEPQQQGRHQQSRREQSPWERSRREQSPREQSRQKQREQRGEQESSEGNNIFSGFKTKLLAEALNIDIETARKLQSQNDNRNNIVRVKGRLDFITPQSSREEREREEEGEREREGGERVQQREEESERERMREQRRHSREGVELGQQIEEESERERDREQRRHSREGGEREQSREEESERERDREQRRHSREGGEREQQRDREREREQRRHSRCDRPNGLEETFCSLRLKENIGDPSRADIFTPQAGRLRSVNSFNLPILSHLRLSAERGVLYNNGIYAPHWNLNAHSIVYVIRGRARTQIVDENGHTLLDNEVRQGQLFVIPQNHAVLTKAGNEGFEYIAFKTNENAQSATLVGKLSFFRALPESVLANAFQVSREEAKKLKYNTEESTLFSSRGSSSRSRSSSGEDERRAVA